MEVGRLSVGTLRPLTETDIEPVVQLVRLAMNPNEGEQARRTLDFHFSCQGHGLNDGRTYHALVDRERIVGITGLHHYEWGPPENVWLAWLAVEPKLRGPGVGKHLLEAACGEARNRGFSQLFVETYSTPEFATARTFYSANGFGIAGIVRSYLPCGGDMVVFSKELTFNV